MLAEADGVHALVELNAEFDGADFLPIVVIVDLGGSFDAGSAVEMVLDSAQMIAFEPHNNFRCLMMLAPEISAGSSYYTVINGSGGKTITLADGQNIVDYK